MNLQTEQHSRTRVLAFISCCAFVVVALFVSAAAQSGRRAPRHEESPPVPTPTPAPTPKHQTEVAQHVGVVVMADTSFSVSSGGAQSIVNESFMQRLRESGSLDITTDSSRTSRGGAQKRAKDEKERFVVWMALRYNGGIGGEPIGIQQRAQDYYIEFAVYDPVTGKTRASGNVYLRAGYGSIGGVAVGAPSCYPATYASQLEFIYGAIDAANRVLKSLDVPLPPLCGR
jgi:hypothetical protein